MWVKLEGYPGKTNLAWVMSQIPDFGWSRAIALNDPRMGKVSMTVGGGWDSGLGAAEVDKWLHVVAVWDQGGTSDVYLNGKKGKAKTHTKNGSGPRIGQKLAIGGRANNDSSHNTASSVSDVRVYDRMLNYQEVAQLYAFGRRSVAPILRNSSVLPDDAYVRLTGKHIEPDCSSVEYKGVLGVFDSSADCLAALKTNKDFNYAVNVVTFVDVLMDPAMHYMLSSGMSGCLHSICLAGLRGQSQMPCVPVEGESCCL